MGIEPTQPAWKAGILPLNYARVAGTSGQPQHSISRNPKLTPEPREMGETGFEPVKAYATRFTVWPLWPLRYSPVFEHFSELTTKPYSDPRRTTPIEVQAQRFNEASGGSRTHNRRFTKPELCQLSYTSADRMRGNSRSIAIEFCQARQILESSQQRRNSHV